MWEAAAERGNTPNRTKPTLPEKRAEAEIGLGVKGSTLNKPPVGVWRRHFVFERAD